ncbi:MAG: hypothetical protein AAGJ31_15305, partial [Verrucomicrobiota bacterium]
MKQSFAPSSIATELVQSYQDMGGINRIGCGSLPSKAAISSLSEDLLHLLFPGFFAEGPIESCALQDWTEC